MKSVKVALVALMNLAFIPITFGIHCWKMAKEELAKPAGNNASYRWKVYKHWLLGYALFTAIWASIVYFSWPYIMAGFNWIVGWGPHLAVWGGVYGTLAIGFLVLFSYIRGWLHKQRSEVIQLQMDLRLAQDSANQWEAQYCELLAGLMVTRKRALDGKKTARSQHAGKISTDLDKVLAENPAYANTLIRITSAVRRWENKFDHEAKPS